MFPRIPFLVCFHIGWPQGRFLRDLHDGRTVVTVVANLLICLIHLQQHQNYNCSSLPLDSPSVSASWSSASVCLHHKEGPQLLQATHTTNTRGDQNRHRFQTILVELMSWGPTHLWSPLNHYLHPYSLPDYLPGGPKAPSDTLTASHM